MPSAEVTKLIAESENLLKDDPSSALSAANKACDLARNAQDQQGQGLAMIAVTSAYLAKKNANIAVKFAEEALTIFQKLADKKMEADAYHNLAQAKATAGLSDEALDAGEEALAMYRSLNDKKSEAHTLHTIAKAFLSKDRHASEAFREAKNAMDLFKELKQGTGAGNALATATEALVAQHNTSEAIRFCKQAMVNFGKSGDKEAEAIATDTYVELFLTKQDNDGALRAAKDGVRRLRELGNLRSVASMTMTIADLQLQNMEYDAAMLSAKEASVLFQDLKDSKAVLAAQKMMTSIYSATGQQPPDSAEREKALALLKDAKAAINAIDGFAYRNAMEKIAKETCGVTTQDIQAELGSEMKKDEFKMLFDNFGDIMPKADQGDMQGDQKVVTPYMVAETLSRKIAYLQFRAGGLGYGPRFQNLRAGYRFGSGWDNQACATIKRYSESEGWECAVRLNPGIFDAGLHTGMAMNNPDRKSVV